MKKVVADKWVAALRSGEYDQGIGRLRSHNDTYCRLGVLCDISQHHELETDVSKAGRSIRVWLDGEELTK